MSVLPSWAKLEEAKELGGQAVRSDHHSFGGRAERQGRSSQVLSAYGGTSFPFLVMGLRECDTKVNGEWLGHIAQMRSLVARYN